MPKEKGDKPLPLSTKLIIYAVVFAAVYFLTSHFKNKPSNQKISLDQDGNPVPWELEYPEEESSKPNSSKSGE